METTTSALTAIRNHHRGTHLTQPCKVTFESGDESQCDVRTLFAVLDYALRVIDAYALECRGLEDYLAMGSDPSGFCQGALFRDVRDDLEAIARRAG